MKTNCQINMCVSQGAMGSSGDMGAIGPLGLKVVLINCLNSWNHTNICSKNCSIFKFVVNFFLDYFNLDFANSGLL